jgi:hypothetical protein
MADHVRIGVFSCTGLLLLGTLLGAGCGGGAGAPTTTWKQSTSVPTDFPKDVPIYPGATVKHAITPESGSGMVVVWETPDTVAAVQAHLIKELEAQGWTVSTMPGTVAKWLGETGVTVVGTRWGRQVSFAVGDQGGKTSIAFIVPWRP